jgi:hypothetical protein
MMVKLVIISSKKKSVSKALVTNDANLQAVGISSRHH